MILSDDRDDGAVSAEFAAVMPALVFFLVLSIDCVGLMSDEIRAEVCVQRAARTVARHASIDTLKAASANCTIHTSQQGEWIEVQAKITSAYLVLGHVWPQAQAHTRVWQEPGPNDVQTRQRNVRP